MASEAIFRRGEQIGILPASPQASKFSWGRGAGAGDAASARHGGGGVPAGPEEAAGRPLPSWGHRGEG
eukprot:720316-Rhodomonas_salina.1